MTLTLTLKMFIPRRKCMTLTLTLTLILILTLILNTFITRPKCKTLTLTLTLNLFMSQAQMSDTDTDPVHSQAHAREGGQRPRLLGRLSKVRQWSTITSSVCVAAQAVEFVPNGNTKDLKLWAIGATTKNVYLYKNRVKSLPPPPPPQKKKKKKK